MRKGKIRLLQFLLVCMMLVFGQTLITQAATVKLNKKKTTLYVTQKETLKVSGTGKKVKWSTSNKKVATVTQKGKVTAKKPGKAVITAKVGKKALKCTVTVKSVYSVKNTDIKLAEEAEIGVKLTYREKGTIYFKVADTDVVTGAWSKKWVKNKTTLNLYAQGTGTTTVTITNTKTKEKLFLNVTVKGPWDDVEVEIPDTIGEQGYQENRMKILSYNFYKKSYMDDFYMNVEMQLVKYGNTGRTNWGEYVFFYDKNGNLLDKSQLYANGLYLNGIYNDDLTVPEGTAKIVFKEYPEYTEPETEAPGNDEPNNGGTTGEPGNREENGWSTSDADKLYGYTNNAAKYAKQAYEKYNEANKNGMLALKASYAKMAASYASMSKKQLDSALAFLQTKATVKFTDGTTMDDKVLEVLACYDSIPEDSAISSDNVVEKMSEMKDGIYGAYTDTLGLNMLASKLKMELLN